MSIFSDYKVGASDDYEFIESCKQMDRQDRYEREHEFDEEDSDDD